MQSSCGINSRNIGMINIDITLRLVIEYIYSFMNLDVGDTPTALTSPRDDGDILQF